MIPLTPSFLVAAAASFVGLDERREDTHRAMVALFLRGIRQRPGSPWSAAFVHHVGFWSHFDFQEACSSWPLPATGSCAYLGRAAREGRVLRAHPEAGDVFLVAGRGQPRFVHTGIVARVVDAGLTPAGGPWLDCITIEGNAGDDDVSQGRGVHRRRRRFHPPAGDRFIRWADLDAPLLGGRALSAPRAA